MRSGIPPLQRFAPGLIVLGLAALGLILSPSIPPGVWHDDGVYLLIAKSLAGGEGLRYAGVFGDLPAAKFPPLYPGVLALIWRLGPEFPDSGLWMAAANTVFVALAAGATLLLLQGKIRWAALLVTAAFLSPEIWRLAVVPLSEPLFMALFLGALWIGSRFERTGSARDAAAFLFLFWAVFHTRTVGIVLLPAVCWGAWRRRWTGEALGVGAVGILGLLPWMLYSRSATARIPEPARDILGSYGPWLVDQVRSHPGKYLEYVVGNASMLLADVSALVLPGAPSWIGWGLIVVMILGAWRVGRSSPAVVCTLGLYLLIVLLWPFQDRRLVVPVFPLLIVMVVGAVPTRSHWARVVVAAWALWFTVASGRTLISGNHLERYRVRSERLVEAASSVSRLTPPDAVVGAPELFAALHLYTGRTVAPSARFLPLAEEGPSWGTELQQYQLWREMDIDHLLVEHGGGVHGSALDRVDAECPNGGVAVLDFLSGSFLVQVGLTDVCYERLID